MFRDARALAVVTLYFNGSEAFPVASTYKVAIAMAILQRVDKGEIALSEKRSEFLLEPAAQ